MGDEAAGDLQKAHRKRIGSSGDRPVTYDRTAHCGRNVIAAVLLWLTDLGDTS